MIWPDHETEKDMLGYRHLVDIIVELSQDHHMLPASIGVFGDWGSGKSSILKMVSSKLILNRKNLVINFNGWTFEGYDDAKSALMETILDRISRQTKISVKAKKILIRLFKRVKWLRLLKTSLKISVGAAVAGPAGAAIFAGMEFKDIVENAKEAFADISDDAVEDYLRKESDSKLLSKGISEFRQEFWELIKETEIETLIVIIDDLDRCLPDTIIETLEAIKLFLFVENSAFILGADERLIEYAVRCRFPELPGEKVEVGRDYLEKLIQYPIRIPALGQSEIETYIAMLFLEVSDMATDKIAAVYDWCGAAETIQTDRALNYAAARKILQTIPDELEENLILSEQLAPLLANGLNGNPRQCKRFLNTLMLRLQMATSRNISLSKRILAKLMLLEYFRPEDFRLLAKLQISQMGTPKEIIIIESKLIDKEKSSNGFQIDESDIHTDETQKYITSFKGDTKSSISTSIQNWLADSFMNGWLKLEPRLSKIDLRPYFYFSRDILGALGGRASRLSPRAQNIMMKLMSNSKAIQQVALNDAKNLDNSDAASIYDEIAQKIKNCEDLSGTGSPIDLLIDYLEVRPELIHQFIILLQQLPEKVLPFNLVPKLKTMTKDTPSKAMVTSLFEKWKTSVVNPKLKKAASNILKS